MPFNNMINNQNPFGGMKPLNQPPDRMQNMQSAAMQQEMQPSKFMNQLRGGVETQRATMETIIQRLEKQLSALKQQYQQRFGGMY